MSEVTKRALEQSLKNLLSKKPITKITINDIAEDCGINRMTFYYHFKDIYDLVEWSCLEDAKKALEEKHRDEMQQLLVAVTQEKDEEKLERLLETVPQEQREMAYATLEVKHYNEKAKRLRMEDNKPAKKLTFNTDTTESVVSNLTRIRDASKENENARSRVTDNYDNSYREPDISLLDSIASPSSRLYSTEIVTSGRKNVKINSKDINSGIDKPLVDLADLIDRIGKK